MTGLDPAARERHRQRNQLHSVLLLAGLAVLVAIPALLISGITGLVIAAAMIAMVAAFGPRMPPAALMRAFKAQEVPPESGAAIIRALQELSRRADLPRTPRLFIVPSTAINAFATGTRDNAVIAVTRGLLDALAPREVIGVVAHEISHIRNHDLWIMGLADLMARFTLSLSYAGLFFAIVNVLAVMGGGATQVPWLAIAILYLAPAVSSLMQLALSRAREYDADLEAALLTGDPDGLANALVRIERRTGSVWQDLALPMPGRRVPQPSLLRTHPETKDRVARLAELKRRPEPMAPPLRLDPKAPVLVLSGFQQPLGIARYRFPAVYY